MIEFWILVTFCVVMALRAVLRLLASRFVDPTDVAQLSTIYYSVPLAIAGALSWNYKGRIFLHVDAADPGLALISLRYVCLALASLEAGRYAGNAFFAAPKFTWSFQLTSQSVARAQIWFLVLFAIMGVGIFLFGIREFLAGYAVESFGVTANVGNALVYASAELIGFAIMLTALFAKATGRWPLKASVLLSLLALGALLVIRAKRLEIVTSLMPTAIILFAARPSFGTFRKRLIGVGIAMTLLVFVSVLRVSDSIDGSDFVYYVLSEGLYASHSLSGVLARIETGSVGYEYGSRFLSALLGFIPSFIWSGKDAMVYAGNEVLKGVSPLGATTFLTEAVLQGGVLAVVIIYSIMGALFERLTKFEQVWEEGLKRRVLPLRFGAYLVAVVIFIPHFRDGIIPAVKLALQSLFFFVLLVGFKHVAGTRKSYQLLPQ
ncbi:MAG: hypothetical protein ABIR08_05840 [Sphingomonas sp.]